MIFSQSLSVSQVSFLSETYLQEHFPDNTTLFGFYFNVCYIMLLFKWPNLFEVSTNKKFYTDKCRSRVFDHPKSSFLSECWFTSFLLLHELLFSRAMQAAISFYVDFWCPEMKLQFHGDIQPLSRLILSITKQMYLPKKYYMIKILKS